MKHVRTFIIIAWVVIIAFSGVYIVSKSLHKSDHSVTTFMEDVSGYE